MKLLIKLIKKAKKSHCRFKVAAIGVNGKGEVIGIKFNRYRFTRKGGGIHAEQDLIHRYGNKLKKIYICRVNKHGKQLPIEPCLSCLKIANKMRIKIEICRK